MIIDTSIWYLISFVIFLALIIKPAKSAVLTALSAKAEDINKNLIEAKRLKEEAAQLLQDAEQAKQDAKLNAKGILEYAKAEISRAQSQTEHDIKIFAVRQEKLVAQRIEDLQNSAKNDIHNKIIDVSFKTAAAVIQDKLGVDKNTEYALHDLKRLRHLSAQK